MVGFRRVKGLFQRLRVRLVAVMKRLYSMLIQLFRTSASWSVEAFRSILIQLFPRNSFGIKTPASLRANYDCVLLCGAFPGGAREYGGEFVFQRVKAYQSAGIKCLVVELSKLNTAGHFTQLGGVCCYRMPIDLDEKSLAFLSRSGLPVLIHSGWPELNNAMHRYIPWKKLAFWFHGFEVRDYRRLYFNYETHEYEKLRSVLDAINEERSRSAKMLFPNPCIKKIFVSEYLRGIAQLDMGARLKNSSVIHNYIDSSHYANLKTLENYKSNKVLLIRSFSNRNYANDIALSAIKRLIDSGGLPDDVKFTICGTGRYFDELTEWCRPYSFIELVNKHLSSDEMRALHQSHCVFLAPTRFDTQGVTLGEAMSSGMLCITNSCTAIPEFVDDSCVRLVPEDDPVEFAKVLKETLYMTSNERFRIAQNGRGRVSSQCGFENTISAELSIIRGMI